MRSLREVADHAVTEHVHGVWVHYAARDQMERELFALDHHLHHARLLVLVLRSQRWSAAVSHRVASIVTTVEAPHNVVVLGEHVGQLPLSLISPLT